MSQFFASDGQSIKSFSFNISQFNEHPGLISFRMGWLDLLAVQGTLKSLLQHHSSKASILQRSVFFMVQVSHPYMTTGKTIALTRRTYVGKVMSLLFNMLSRLVIQRRQWQPTPILLPGRSHGLRSLVGCSPWGHKELDMTEQLNWTRLVITFLPRSKHLLISWLQSPSAVTLERKKIKSVTTSIVIPSICHEVMGLDAKIFVFSMLSLSQLFHSPRSPSSRWSLVPLHFLPDSDRF